MSQYLLLGAAIGGMTWLNLMPTLRDQLLALPGYAFVLILSVTLATVVAAQIAPHFPRRWRRLAIGGLDYLARQLRAPIGVTLGLGIVAALHALYFSNAIGSSAAVALACMFMSLSFAGLAINLRHLASAWRKQPFETV